MRSDIIKLGVDKTPQRALLKGMGYVNEEIANPFIGIICSYSEISPGHSNLRQLAEAVKAGVRLSGGTPIEIDTISVCDGIAIGHAGTNYALASRELVADTVETIIGANGFDAVVLVANCENMVSGMLMGAARINIPTIMVCGGVMPVARTSDGLMDMTDIHKALQLLKAGEISNETLAKMEEAACVGCGACGVPGANTMSFAAEALGMTLPGNSTCTAGSGELYRLAKQAGMKIMELLSRNLTPSRVITPRSLANALAVDAAFGGKPNTILHLRALAHEFGLQISAEVVNGITARTPVLCRLSPQSDKRISDLHLDGGIPGILRVLNRYGLINADALAVTGKVILAQDSAADGEDGMEASLAMSAPLRVISGNLAPEGAMLSWNDAAKSSYSGPARVFDSERAAMAAFEAGAVRHGDVVVIRFKGPKGGPGMRELAASNTLLARHSLAQQVAFVSDGRFSSWRQGLTVQQVSPEAAAGGPLAAVHDGDIITIDAESLSLSVSVSAQELSRRLKGWTPPEPAVKGGYLSKYARLVSSAATGAVTR